jgi:hypothetical protein
LNRTKAPAAQPGVTTTPGSGGGLLMDRREGMRRSVSIGRWRKVGVGVTLSGIEPVLKVGARQVKRWLAYGVPCGICGFPVHSWALGLPTSPLDCRCTRLVHHWSQERR